MPCKNSILNPPTDPWQKVSGGFSSVAWLTQISPLPVAALRRPRFQVFWFQNKLAEIWSDANPALLPSGSWVPVGGLLATRLKSNIWVSGHMDRDELMNKNSQPSYRGLGKDAEPLGHLPALGEAVTHEDPSIRGSPKLAGQASDFYFWLDLYPWKRHLNFFAAVPT